MKQKCYGCSSCYTLMERLKPQKTIQLQSIKTAKTPKEFFYLYT